MIKQFNENNNYDKLIYLQAYKYVVWFNKKQNPI